MAKFKFGQWIVSNDVNYRGNHETAMITYCENGYRWDGGYFSGASKDHESIEGQYHPLCEDQFLPGDRAKWRGITIVIIESSVTITGELKYTFFNERIGPVVIESAYHHELSRV